MKKGLIVLFAVGLIFLINYASAISNPSAVYCESLGYRYEINNTANGDVGICAISKDIKLDAWDFFEGKAGQQYSYCAKKGYSSQTVNDGKNSFSEEYAACIINSSANKELIMTNKSVTDLMNFSERLNYSTLHSDKKSPSKIVSVFYMFISLIRNIAGSLTGNAIGSFNAKLPESFDWRNYNGNWITPVKNQGSCGSCWAFATIGGVESKIKIARGDSNFDVDLSEQDLVSCGVPYGFYSGSGGCEGATLEDPLNYLNTSGVTDEACFSYTASDEKCNKCSSSDKRLWKIDNYGYVPLTEQDMKNYLVTNGPIITGIYMAGSFVNGIYTCSNPKDNLNHAVVIVGYNDTGKYWIVRNSWGSNWNGDGYFNVGYGKCNIEIYPMFVDLQFNSSQKINIAKSEVSLGTEEGKYEFLYSKDNLSMSYKEGCNNSDCTGYEARNIFSLKNLPEINSIDLIAYQNSSNEKETSLNYWNENSKSWESLGTIPSTSYLIKYSLCVSSKECASYFSEGSLSLEYIHPKSQNSSVDFSSIDMLYLEANAGDCTDNWILNRTWSSCNRNDLQYKNYYDLNSCYKNLSYFSMNVSQSCDYCTPSISQINGSCGLNDSFVSWYNDSNRCFSITGLQNDKILDNQTLSCDFCLPNWTENQICNPDNSVTTWHNDSNSCFEKTGLSSDSGMSNQTVPNSCIYNSSNSSNNSNSSTNQTLFCGDGICNNEESCSSCAADCGTCPVPVSSSSGGGGGNRGSSENNQNTVLTSQAIVNETINSNIINSNNPESGNKVDETVSVKENKQSSFSLTGLMVSMQNNSSLKIVLISIIGIGLIIVFILFRENKFSRKQLHKNIAKIHRKRK